MVGDRWRCKNNGEMATELPEGRGWNRGLLKLRLDYPIPRLFWRDKRVIYVERRSWERAS